MSIVEPAQIVVPGRSKSITLSWKGLLPGQAGKFSGEVDGHVTSQSCCGYSTSVSRKNCAEPLSKG